MAKRWLLLVLMAGLCWPSSGVCEEKPTEVRFRSTPDGATVVVDGKDRCVAPCKMSLHVGTHVVGMSRDGYLAREEMLDISGRTQTIKWRLEAHLGTLSVLSDPEGLEVEVRGAKGGKRHRLKTPVAGLELAEGTYDVTLTDDRYAGQERRAEVIPGEASQVVLEPVPTKGSLSIQVLDEGGDPDKANITLNGKRYRGSGPWSLKPGTYQVKVKYRGQVILDQPINVDAGSDIALDVESEPTP